MNIQTERLDNHIARLTVEIDAERLEKAKQTAARKLSGRVNIPGFRKGKAPYRILVNYVGEAAVIEEAVEVLGNDIYKEALEGSKVDPYGPGSLEDFKLIPNPTFIFTVPLQPEVHLGAYRDIRMEFSVPPVEDAAVDSALKALQNEHAVVEESARPVEVGNRVTVDIHSHFVGDPAEGQEGGKDGEEVLHQHDAQINLDPSDEPIAPGFIEALLGTNKDEEKEFQLTFPDDKQKYEEMAGRKVEFHVTVKKIENVTLPALNDDFAARITANEEKPLTLLELRMRTREELGQMAESRAKSAYAQRVLDKIVEGATVAFPEAMVEDQIEDMLEGLDRNLRQQGVTLKDYMQITKKTRQDLGKDYRETAINMLRRSLVLRQVLHEEGLEVTDTQINAEVERMLSAFGEQREMYRQFLTRPEMLSGMRNDLLQQQTLERIGAIARGEAPEKGAPVPADEPVASLEDSAPVVSENAPAASE
ncbi:MAG: trigger factor [Chloroflexi bacterium]|nr:trigger factor [Chloroflexota bacterium]